MMEPRVIKTEEGYDAALAHVETLMDAAPGSPEEAELEVFAVLIDVYEAAHHPIELPDPIEAIKFRMEQEGLLQKDLVPFMGSQSKVSEVLNRKRPLSLRMMRGLHEGLGLPAEVLLQEPGEELPEEGYDRRDYPFAEMFRRGYFDPFPGSLREARLHGEALLVDFFSIFEGTAPRPVLGRRTDGEPDVKALLAWQARALGLAQEEVEDVGGYDPEMVRDEALGALVRQSYFSTGPQNARELLNRWGVHLIILRHLPKTYLDGAAFVAPWGNPVVGLTLRYDRLDNFWFTLLHELAHVRLHLDWDERDVAFFDETHGPTAEHEDEREGEADAFAREMLIAADVWERERSSLLPKPGKGMVRRLAEELRISPAIVAGRVRYETGNYRQLGSLVGAYQVREQFEEYGTKEDGWA